MKSHFADATQDGGLRGRLAPPSFMFEPVANGTIGALLDGRELPRLVTATAPAGYGKTILLTRLHDSLLRRGYRCLWIGLDDRDHDLPALYYLVQAALEKAGISSSDERGNRREALADQGRLLDDVLAGLAQLEGPAALFIDNLGSCRDPHLGVALQRIVAESPPSLHLVFSSTLPLPLDLARTKLAMDVLELQAPQLCFDHAATASLFRNAGLTGVSEAELARIQAQTEGWPAAVRLVQVLMSAPGQQVALQDLRFGGDQSDMAQVLTRHVLVGFVPEQLTFLMEVALLPEFSVELAGTVTGCDHAGPWISSMVVRNMLIFPLDRDRRWYRFHTLLRQYLLAEGSEHLSAARRSEVLTRAAQWHVDQGDCATAIGLALDGRAWSLAQALLERVAPVVAGDQGRMTAFIDWTDRLLAAGAQPSIEAYGWYVWALGDAMQYERARNALDILDARMASLSPAELAAYRLRGRIEFLRIVVGVFIDRMEAVRADALDWLTEDQARDPLSLAAVESIAAGAEADRGNLLAAQYHMERAEGAIRRADSGYGLAWQTILSACIDMALARPDLADRRLSAARPRIVQTTGSEASVVATCDFVHARALTDLGREAAASPLATRGLARAAHHGIVASAEQGFAACVALWDGTAGTAFDPAALAQVAYSYPVRARCFLLASVARRLLRLGRLDEAQQAAQRALDLVRASENQAELRMHPRGDWMLLQIELLTANGNCAKALANITTQLKLAQRDGRQRDRIELHLAAADALMRMAQPKAALRMLALAVGLAAPGQAYGPFHARGALVRDVLSQFEPRELGFTQPLELEFVARLVGPAQVAAVARAATLMVDMPTPREISLLGLMDQGLNNQQIADRLQLSVATVKWHLSNLYTKLGVRNRSSALAAARSRKLIGPG